MRVGGDSREFEEKGFAAESIYDVSGNQEVQLQAPALLGTAGRTVLTPDRCSCGRPCTVINFAGDRLASINVCAGSARSLISRFSNGIRIRSGYGKFTFSFTAEKKKK